MKNLYAKYKELILYLVFGVLTTLVNIIAYFVFTNIGIYYQISNVIAWVLSVTFAFFTNKYYVFESKEFVLKKVTQEAASFYGFRLVSLGLDVAFMYLLVSILSWNDLISKVVVNVIVIVVNYIFSKVFTFKKDTI